MVDTALCPRTNFYTFFLSDLNKGGGGLTYYDYQRALRSNKFTILQQKKAASYVPGYKKPVILPTSRKIFQLKNTNPKHADFNLPGKSDGQVVNETVDHSMECFREGVKKSESVESNNDAMESNIPTSSNMISFSSTTKTETQTEKLPHVNKNPNSATARDHQISDLKSASASSLLKRRPKTISGTRDIEVQTSQSQLAEGISHQPVAHHRSQSEGANDFKNYTSSLTEREELCKAYQWGTTTQRAYDEVGWPDQILPPMVLPLTTTIADPVSQKVSFRRYYSDPAGWQIFGNEWDRVQTRRRDTFPKGPQAIKYYSSHGKTQQIPGYMGCIPQLSMFEDDSVMNIVPQFLVRTIQPRISRKANIPGYMGHVHWTKVSPMHSKIPTPEPTTSARVHRAIPLEDEMSPFRRDGIFSKMITTVSPHNPFNKIQF